MSDPHPTERTDSGDAAGERKDPRHDDRPAIRLDDVLKLAGIATTGGQAKRLIQAGEVRVNGAVETRRKHLLHEGDEVEVGDEAFVVELNDEADDQDIGDDELADDEAGL